ncbi:F-box protein [Rickettsiales endosymbiont of Stachyamoeba lipophora]|uniref:F-box protein n=1 Tax=Rickettsiales endosymbiont of Stachyamoeba lipophora TaxID=2486578 RepID=UPI000F64E7F4|nr:F-box protein [Rickettsiales endosymbiont of Stachyamoeba lipophora]AZL16107.1 hypothetical protein EF513_06130 [Rickettsiales endosymbiont of Stachyamoeba lipophora]
MTNETLDTQVTALNNEPDDSLLPLDVIYNLFGFLPNKDLARHRLVSNKWQKYVKKALAYYAKGMFDPKYIDTAFLSKLQVPLEHARTFIDYRYKGLQEDKNDIQLDRYFEGNAAAITPGAQEAVTVETLIKVLHDLEQKQQKINSKQKVEIEYTINSLEGLVNYIKAYDQLKDKHYLLNINFNKMENSSCLLLLLNIIKLSNNQNLQQRINISYNNEVIQVTCDQAKHIANHITVFELAYRHIKAEGAKTIADALKANTTITFLQLKSNSIGTEEALAIADALKTNTTLASLNLDWNSIGAAGALAIADALKANTTLTSLNLNWNDIGAAGALAIADALTTNKALNSITLEENSITDVEAKDLADALKINTTLTSLNLDENSIGAAGALAIADALKANTTLTSLNLDKNSISYTGAKELADALKTNTTLASLNLNRNSIGDAGAQELADALTINTALRSLNLEYNSIEDAGAKELANALKTNKALRSLNLRHNKIGDAGAQAIADALNINKSLTSLNLRDNYIGAEGAGALGKASAYVKQTQNRDITIVLDDDLIIIFEEAKKEELARLEKLEAQEKLKSPEFQQAESFADMAVRQEKGRGIS